MNIETQFSIGDRLRYYTMRSARQIDFVCTSITVHLTASGHSEWYSGKSIKHPVHVSRLQKIESQ